MLTILDGSTFVVSDDIGDVGSGAEGVFADDTRMLSRCRLLLDGESPLLLTSRAVDYFSATHYLRNAPTIRIPADTLSIGRERFVGSSVTEHLTLSNESMSELSFPVDLELAADFADIISVKAHDFAFGDPESAPPLPVDRVCSSGVGSTFELEDDEGYRTTIRFSHQPELTPAGARFSVSLPPHARWELTFDVNFGAGSRAGAALPRPDVRHRAPARAREPARMEAAGAATHDPRTRPPARVRAFDRRPCLAPAEGNRGDR